MAVAKQPKNKNAVLKASDRLDTPVRRPQHQYNGPTVVSSPTLERFRSPEDFQHSDAYVLQRRDWHLHRT
jgi:hypothetical protein